VTSKRHLTVGVLGGMGPEATLDFFRRVIGYTPARTDQDHLHLIIDNDPSVPNRNDAIAGTGPSPAPQLAAMARRLADAGADFLVIACNSAYAFESAVREATPIPLVSIVDETARELAQKHPGSRKVGLLAASACLKAHLYQRAFDGLGVETIEPRDTELDAFMQALYPIKAGERGADITTRMAAIADALIDRGAEIIVAACTEVPLVLPAERVARPLLDSTDVLAARTVLYATGAEPLPVR